MRQALNENPVVQATLIGLLVVGVAFLLLTRVMSSNSQGDATEPVAESPVAAVPADPAASAATPAAGTPGGQAGGGATPATDFVAGPGLPESVVNAYDDGSAVVLLVTRKAGIEDKRMRAIVGQARSVGNVAVFTANAHGIARYSRIAGGVDVSRVPALVVIRPQKFQDAVPLASVSYGFRGPDSVKQAVRDALYEGRDALPYYPR